MKLSLLIQMLFLTVLVSCGSDDASTSSSTFVLRGSSSASAGFIDFLAPVYNGDPTSLKMKIYEVLVSANADCTSPVSLCTHSGADAIIDLVSNPTLCSGSPAAGTYQCIILKISDTFTFKPDATAAANVPGGICVAGADSQMDIYREGEADDNLWQDLNGAFIDATGSVATPGDDTVYIFATTLSLIHI